MESQLRKTSHIIRRVGKRSIMDIIAAILSEAQKGAKKTRIMYKCNLSYKQLQVYLKLVLNMNFLELRSDLYQTSHKGYEFLDSYNTLKALML